MTTAWPLPSRIAGVLRAPRATFDALARAPRSADVLVVAFLVAATASALVLETELGQLALLDYLERTATAFGQPLDETQYAALEEVSANGTAYAIVTAFVSGPLLAVVLSGILTVWGQTQGPAPAPTYRQVLAVVSHAAVILALRQVVVAPFTYVRETLTSPLTLSMFFTLLDESSPVARFAGMVDLFVVWWIVVLAIGVSVLYRRPAARLAAAFAAVYILLAALAAIVLAATGGSA